MYQSTYTSPPTQPFTSPPPDPYHSSPIPVIPRQAYNGAFSPPPIPPNVNGFPPMSSGQARYNQFPSSQQYSRAPSNRYAAPSPYAQRPQQLSPARHKGTLAPGKIVQVGDRSVRIERYLSEGGYAHVYLTSSEKPIYPPIKGEKKGRWGERGYTEHCLKRIAFEDEAVWADVKKEIEVMKALPPNPHLTQYLGSAHSRLPNAGYEVFILMEFCAGGGIIDLLNKRLRDRLKEIEILNIFTDVCEAVAAMHALTRPLLHRDLKIENVLSQPTSSPPSAERPTPLMFKLCDFGSTTFPASRPPSTKLEVDSLNLDLNKHTTLPYRSPEMVEPMLGWPVGLPSDIWALGVLLYKLCYYTTPFEEHGTLAIVNAKYTFPQYPVYSPRLQHLIAAMLVEQPIRRPTIFEVLTMAHDMSGTRPEVDYPAASRSIPAYTSAPQPLRDATSSNLLDFTSSEPTAQDPQIPPPALIPSVQPGRRGRPTKEPNQMQEPPEPTRAVRTPQPRTNPEPQVFLSLNHRMTAAPGISVTGEKFPKAASNISVAQNIDAFGMPSSSKGIVKVADGFGDSFEARASGPRSGSAAPVSQQSSLLGNGSRGKALTDLHANGSKPSEPASSTNLFPTTFGLPRTKSPGPVKAGKPDSSSSIPSGEVGFETRFPSIETLSSEDAFSPSLQAASTSRSPPVQPDILISPVISPPPNRPKSGPRQQSIMGSLTGGQGLSAHQPSSAKADRAPQPHSTHVTGTAFQAKPVGSHQTPVDLTMAGYFDAARAQDNSVLSKSPPDATRLHIPDLMTGEESSDLSMLSMQMAMSSDPTANTGQLPLIPADLTRPPVSSTTEPQASTYSTSDLLSQLNSEKHPSSLNADQQPLVEQVRDNERDTSTKREKRAESSDEETGPEDASATYRRPMSPVRRDSADRTPALDGIATRRSAFENGLSKGTERRKSATTPLPKPEALNVRPPDRRQLTRERSRSQSMYDATASRSSQSLSAPSEAESQAVSSAKTSERPAHIRKGSITDMMTRFESLHSPVKATSSGGNSSTNGISKKPSVAAKPVSLRNPTAEEKSQLSESIQPAKPTIPVKYAPKPVRYSQTPAPHGFSRSSSGRSFPVSKPAIAAKPERAVNEARQKMEPGNRSDGVRPPDPLEEANSPEKQQTVNLLIQRWNQGGVGKPQIQPKRDKYI